jgi:hypothetical protein
MPRQKLPSRKRLFDDIQAFTTYFCFDKRANLLDFMLEVWPYKPESRIVRSPKPQIGWVFDHNENCRIKYARR